MYPCPRVNLGKALAVLLFAFSRNVSQPSICTYARSAALTLGLHPYLRDEEQLVEVVASLNVMKFT